jgi:hypothetical protein
VVDCTALDDGGVRRRYRERRGGFDDGELDGAGRSLRRIVFHCDAELLGGTCRRVEVCRDGELLAAQRGGEVGRRRADKGIHQLPEVGLVRIVGELHQVDVDDRARLEIDASPGEHRGLVRFRQHFDGQGQDRLPASGISRRCAVRHLE